MYASDNAASYFLKKCQATEQSFNFLRKNLPAFMLDVAGTIEALESSNFCQVTYKQNPAMIDKCENAYDHILQRGLTSTLYMVFNYAQQMTVRFEMEPRTDSFMNDRLQDGKFRDLLDLTTLYLHDALQLLQSIMTENALAYFNKLINYYVIIYGVYMGLSIFLCFFFGFFVFKKLRQQIIASGNILAIMPLEELDIKDRAKIESFLNS